MPQWVAAYFLAIIYRYPLSTHQKRISTILGIQSDFSIVLLAGTGVAASV